MMGADDTADRVPLPDNILEAIEARLERERPAGWRRLDAHELKASPRRLAAAGWSISALQGELECDGVSDVRVYLDDLFPYSQPIIVAAGADRNFTWPHVEVGGYLCLPTTRPDGEPGERIAQHLHWAGNLLSLDESQRRKEFEREFVSYWAQRASPGATQIVSLVRAGPPSREIVYYIDGTHRAVLADSAAALEAWLRNAGKNPGRKDIGTSYLLWLSAPPIPSEFPEKGQDVFEHVPPEVLQSILRPGCPLPILIGAQTTTGAALAGVVVRGASEADLQRGFRKGRIPYERVKTSFASRQLTRGRVARVDGAWIHGRDVDPSYSTLAETTVCIVGCGAIGSIVARLLAQSGVGSFILVDHDNLTPPNTSRHALGNASIGENKTKALAALLQRDFPHLREVRNCPKRFEDLQPNDQEAIAGASLILSAGVPFATDAAIDRWRRSKAERVPHVMAWTEEFALVGHAVAVFGSDTIHDYFDGNGEPTIALTDWDAAVQTRHVEAGCGNVFQPHGAIDLHAVVTLAARSALDILTGTIAVTSRRVWLGDRDRVFTLGGKVRAAFDRSFTMLDVAK